MRFRIAIPLVIFLYLIVFSANGDGSIDSLLVAARNTTGVEQVKTLIRISRALFINEDTTGIQYARQAIRISDSIGYPEGRGMADLFLGLLVELIDPMEAIPYLNESSDTLIKYRHSWAGFGYENVARIWKQLGMYPEALDATLKEIKACEISRDSTQLARAYSDIGYLNQLMGKYSESFRWQWKAMTIARRLEVPDLTGLIYGRIGITFDESGEYDSANYYNKLAISYFEKSDQPEYIPQWLSNLANTAIKQQKFDIAEKYLDRALSTISDVSLSPVMLVNLGNIYTLTGRYQEAGIILDSAIRLTRKLNQPDFMFEAYYRKYELYSKTREPDSALFYYKAYHQLSDSLNSLEKSRHMSMMQVKFETAEKEKELLVQKSARAEAERQKAVAEIKLYRRNNWLAGVTSFAAIIVFVLLWYYERKRSRLERLRQEEVAREREKGILAVLDVQEKERQRIARDLHDSVGQQLSAVRFAVQAIENRAGEENPDLVTELSSLKEMVTETASEIRSISHQMMPRALMELGLVPALQDMLEKSFKIRGITYTFEHHGMDERLTNRLEVGLYRIAQELTGNILKHSGASHVTVQLTRTQTHCVLVVSDNGKGIQKDSGQEGIGIGNIENRLRMLQGEMKLTTAEGRGTTATIRVALNS
ncbi:MAG: hypothetical protein Kow00127_07850 [Bacteroidales bacterium]